MGGCCCCLPRRPQLNEAPVCYYCPQDLEEHGSLSSGHATTSPLSTGLLVDTNLETSIPDTYRAPPAPLPYDVDLVGPQTSSRSLEISGDKINPEQVADSQPAGETVTDKNVVLCEDLKGSGIKNQTDDVPGSLKSSEIEASKSIEPVGSEIKEEDACPTCFEEYDTENPRIITKCGHHFHLSCILEWMERSDTCPICDQEMVFNSSFDQ
ncbi:probable E3 ubiquitin-protein ligase RHB1A [Magnolia sinica]|uniref:probable E3 ubiquitin-protein ligase RHB1A n=1 Tax=Magnolia sinica TaxID=86752 RepID=UPI00265814BA|nr:probable E3 ubiquitin-protein ligase RHB1A [Magnolia sinica]